MEIAYQIMMGVSLAACAGFRAWLPLFVAGIMARTGHISLNGHMDFLGTNTMLIIFGVASVVEFLGDKIIAIDHILDSIGTIARPVAGTLLVSSMITNMDFSTTLVLGLIVGGGTSLTMHAGKAIARAKASLLAPFHGGSANAALSIGEDFISGLGSLTAIFWPVLAFVFALFMLAIAVGMIYLGYKTGSKIYRAISSRPAQQPVLVNDPATRIIPTPVTVEPQ